MTVEALISYDGEPIFISSTPEWLKMIGVVLELKLPTLSQAPLIGGVLSKESIEPILGELPKLSGKVDERLITNFQGALEEALREGTALALV